MPGEFPPLTGTDWVTGDKGRLIRAVLHGMQGSVEIMPGPAFLSDGDVTTLLTYLRSAFGNSAEPVHASEVPQIS